MDEPYDWAEDQPAPIVENIEARCPQCKQPSVMFVQGGVCPKCSPYFNSYKEGASFDLPAAPDFAYNPLERMSALNPTVDAMIHNWAEHGITELEGWMSDK